MAGNQKKEVVREYLSRFSEGDYEHAFELVADDVDWWILGDLPISGEHTGESFIELMEGLNDTFPDGVEMWATNMVAEGNEVVAECRSHGPMPGGDVYENQYLNWYVVEDGIIQEVREYPDTLYIKETLLGGE